RRAGFRLGWRDYMRQPRSPGGKPYSIAGFVRLKRRKRPIAIRPPAKVSHVYGSGVRSKTENVSWLPAESESNAATPIRFPPHEGHAMNGLAAAACAASNWNPNPMLPWPCKLDGNMIGAPNKFPELKRTAPVVE